MSAPHRHRHGVRTKRPNGTDRSSGAACHGERCRLRTQSNGSRCTTRNTQSRAAPTSPMTQPCFQPKSSTTRIEGRLRSSSWWIQFVPEQRSP
jgi:hypothetical protein